MRAICWHGKGDMRVDTVPDPRIEQPGDAIIRITATAICGSDLHLYDGYVPMMKEGDIMGHEPMGIVEEVGPEVTRLKKGDRVVVPFVIACGSCFFCEKSLFSCCDTTNPDAAALAELQGHAGAGLFGYSHLYGGYPGGQAQYLRVPHADVGPVIVQSDLPDEKVLFLSDILPTGWQAAEQGNIQPGDTVAVWGCGPVGQMAIISAWLLGAGRVIAIDRVPERLEMARVHGKAEVIDFTSQDVYDQLQVMTKGRGPDVCIDAVGAETHGLGSMDAMMDKAKAAVGLTTDRIHALRQAINCCRKGGTVSVPGVYIGFPDKFPMGAAFGKGLTMRMGQTHAQRFLQPLLDRIDKGEIDPSFVITHKLSLEEGPKAYDTFRDKKDGCIKVVLTP
ncbi:glutathione-dependent formaldehyde dehydrogenase [Roseomonas stagni]|uniref:Glutathione-dependent formaldehyde dehydrogenase n=1 Tax=Falsiroseomonas algicola TaxID=2716930 RepID=A0A6M1LIM2_9PROT|nr:zinc-dependent alcohol dehydrogenase [Falsiroseomonas algicola]NGM20156.1 glutathione-dependent formaldehyde dehydrogenase [Falsiroseomonas algicola]